MRLDDKDGERGGGGAEGHDATMQHKNVGPILTEKKLYASTQKYTYSMFAVQSHTGA